MKYGVLFVSVCAFAILILSAFSQPGTEQRKTEQWYAVRLDTLRNVLEKFVLDVRNSDTMAWKKDFLACRRDYKRIEFIVAYYFPFAEQRMNGPAVYEVEPSDFSEINFPSGFQVIEECLYGARTGRQKEVLEKQLANLLSYVKLLQNRQSALLINDASLYDALRCELYALAAKGLSAFDAPASSNALYEAITVIGTAKEVLVLHGTMDSRLLKELDRSAGYLQKDPGNVDGFDRALFLRRYFGPLLKALYQQQLDKGIAFARQRGAVRKDVESFLAANAFDPYFFASDTIVFAGAEKINLGKKLFSEPALSLGGRSCATCHKPELAYTDGLPRNRSLQRDEMILRNTPTILNAALQPVLFSDARAGSLEQQAHDVLFSREEMDAYLEKAIGAFRRDDDYRHAFEKAFPGRQDPFTQDNIIAALTAFERSLVKLDAPFDRYMRGDSLAMSPQQVRGFNLFMGRARCGTCHYLPLFNGVVPPFYTRSDTEIIGLPESPGSPLPDKDPGAYAYYRNEIKRGAFKTPTLRNAALTAPYMHNGRWESLEAVIDFYDEGGGAGAGLEVPYQTLPGEKLQLSAEEKQNLIAFIKALNDN